MFNSDIFLPKAEYFCNFEQAVEYIAFGWEPLNEEYEDILTEPRKRFNWVGDALSDEGAQYQQKIKRAIAKLKLLMKAGLKFMAAPYYKGGDRFSLGNGFYTLYEEDEKYLHNFYRIEFSTMQNINDLRNEFINASAEALLPTKVVSAYTGLSLSWFNCRAVSGGGMPYTKIGRHRQYKKQDVLNWLTENTKKTKSTSEY